MHVSTIAVSRVRAWRNRLAFFAVCLLTASAAGRAQTVTEFATPNIGNAPFFLAAGPDNTVWFTFTSASGGTAIGKLSVDTGAIANYTAGGSDMGINSFAAGSDGNVWFTASGTNRIGRITPAGVITQFSAGLSPGAGLASITPGPDGALWFIETLGNRIGRIHPFTGTITEYSTGITANAGLRSIVAGSDGSLWFTESQANKIGRISTDGVVAEYGLLTANAGVSYIERGSDDNLWFVEYNLGRIGRITPSGIVSEFPASMSGSIAINGLRRGADGNLWFTEYAANKIGRITVSGVVTEYAVPTAGANPEFIAAAGGRLWFSERSTGQFASILPATGVITELPVGLPSNANLGDIAMDDNGNHWFVLYASSQLGRITPSGVITRFSNIPFLSAINGMVRGPDGNLWFAEYQRNAIGRLDADTGAFTEFTAGITPQAGPEDIALGRDGNLWFTERSTGYLGKITPAGVITEHTVFAAVSQPPYRLTTTDAGGTFFVWFSQLNSDYVVRFNPATIALDYYPVSANSGISAMTSDADGNVWFTEDTANKIGRITPAGVLTEFSAGLTPDAGLRGIAVDYLGNVWFTESRANKIGRITPDGVIREYDAGISPSAGLHKIAVGYDGAMWFTEKTANRIGRITLPCDGPDTVFCSGFEG